MAEPPAPKLPAGASPQDRAAAQCDWLAARVAWAVASRLPEKEIGGLNGQLERAIRLHARLSGALDVTEGQIVRSAPWGKLMIVVRDALRDHPKALAAVVSAVEAYEGVVK